jgi:hypothetical protein
LTSHSGRHGRVEVDVVDATARWLGDSFDRRCINSVHYPFGLENDSFSDIRGAPMKRRICERGRSLRRPSVQLLIVTVAGLGKQRRAVDSGERLPWACLLAAYHIVASMTFPSGSRVCIHDKGRYHGYSA